MQWPGHLGRLPAEQAEVAQPVPDALRGVFGPPAEFRLDGLAGANGGDEAIHLAAEFLTRRLVGERRDALADAVQPEVEEPGPRRPAALADLADLHRLVSITKRHPPPACTLRRDRGGCHVLSTVWCGRAHQVGSRAAARGG